jgi:hypothetical protein
MSLKFLKALGISDDEEAIDLILQEYVVGSGANLTYAETKRLNVLKQRMQSHYKISERSAFHEIAIQNCSDMFLEVGKLLAFQGCPAGLPNGGSPNGGSPNSISMVICQNGISPKARFLEQF